MRKHPFDLFIDFFFGCLWVNLFEMEKIGNNPVKWIAYKGNDPVAINIMLDQFFDFPISAML